MRLRWHHRTQADLWVPISLSGVRRDRCEATTAGVRAWEVHRQVAWFRPNANRALERAVSSPNASRSGKVRVLFESAVDFSLRHRKLSWPFGQAASLFREAGFFCVWASILGSEPAADSSNRTLRIPQPRYSLPPDRTSPRNRAHLRVTIRKRVAEEPCRANSLGPAWPS